MSSIGSDEIPLVDCVLETMSVWMTCLSEECIFCIKVIGSKYMDPVIGCHFFSVFHPF